jgi:teichuronic acid biosynthesis glycosyltransferase TuaG
MTNSSAMVGNPPCVSIIVTTNKRVKLLAETLNSILSQTYADFELIIVDNMSEDGTREYVTGMNDPRICYFRNPNNGIIAVNRNFGIKLAKGKYVAFCDDDDLWMPEKLQNQIDVMNKDVEIGLCYTNGCAFRDGNIIHERIARKKVFDQHFRRLLWENCIPSSSVLIRKEVFDKSGLIDERPDLVAVEDYEMWVRIAYFSKLAYVDKVLISYRLHNNFSSNLSKIALKNVLALKGLRYKLGINPFLILRSIFYQYAKYVYFVLASK